MFMFAVRTSVHSGDISSFHLCVCVDAMTNTVLIMLHWISVQRTDHQYDIMISEILSFVVQIQLLLSRIYFKN